MSRLFADDCVLYRRIKSPSDAQDLQVDLDNFQQWENTWLMQFHPTKCQVLRITNKRKPTRAIYTIHGHALEEVDSAKYLGVTIDQKLNWNHHVHTTAVKANGTRAFVQQNLRTAPRHVKAACYTALVRPMLEYASTVWTPHSIKSAHALEMVQRRAARYTTHNYSKTASVSAMLDDLGWETLAERRAKARTAMMFRMENNLVDIQATNYLQRPQTTGISHAAMFMRPYCRTVVYQASFFPATVVYWNALPAQLVSSPSIEAFKGGLAGLRLL